MRFQRNNLGPTWICTVLEILMKLSNVGLWYLINLVLHPYLKSLIKSCLIIENWHFAPLLTYESAFLGLFSNAISASVSSPEPWGESQQAPGPPHLGGLRCSWGFRVPGVSGNCIPGHRHNHSIRTVGLGYFSFLFKDPSAEWLGLLPSFSTCRCEALLPTNHYKTCVKFPSLFFL